MNVTFHVLGSFATAAVLSFKPNEKIFSRSAVLKYAIGFTAGVLIHGVLDYLPHEYPFGSKTDIVIGLFLLPIALLIAQRQNFLLILVCFAGCLFPDIIDLGPAIANKYLGIPLPQLPYKIFPWHWKEFSGSLYNAARRVESTVYHLVFVAICVCSLYANRRKLFRF